LLHLHFFLAKTLDKTEKKWDNRRDMNFVSEDRL